MASTTRWGCHHRTCARARALPISQERLHRLYSNLVCGYGTFLQVASTTRWKCRHARAHVRAPFLYLRSAIDRLYPHLMYVCRLINFDLNKIQKWVTHICTCRNEHFFLARSSPAEHGVLLVIKRCANQEKYIFTHQRACAITSRT